MSINYYNNNNNDDDDFKSKKYSNCFSMQPPAIIESLRPEDVVCGRGDQHVAQSGNLRFYRLIDEHLEQYKSSTTKFEKSRVVQAIFSAIAPGRFLKKGSRHQGGPRAAAAPAAAVLGSYEEMDDKEARQKISHALRYRLKVLNAAADADTSKATGATSPWETATTCTGSMAALPFSATTITESITSTGTSSQHESQSSDSQDQQQASKASLLLGPQPQYQQPPPPPQLQEQASNENPIMRNAISGPNMFSDVDLFSVLGDPSVFQSTQTIPTDRLMRLFARDDRRDAGTQSVGSSTDSNNITLTQGSSQSSWPLVSSVTWPLPAPVVAGAATDTTKQETLPEGAHSQDTKPSGSSSTTRKRPRTDHDGSR